MSANVVPFIYFWEESYGGKPTIMTAAVQWEGLNFGLSFPTEENVVRKDIDKKKLINHMKEIVSVLAIHGRKVLDKTYNIDPRLVNEQEAMRWKLDPTWDKTVQAVGKLTKVKEITREDAIKLKLL